MPRPGSNRIPEKAKDFKGSMIRLIKNLNKWKYLMLLALIVAFISAILALIAPKKLSQFADVINEGLVPNTKKLTQITNAINSNLNTEETLQRLKELELTQEEQLIVDNVLNSTEENKLLMLPENILVKVLTDIQIDNQVITSEDQAKFLTLRNNNLEQLPNNIYSLIEPKINMDKIKELTIFMAALYITSALFNYIQAFSLSTVSNRFANSLRKNVTIKINKLPLKYFDTHETGYVLSRVTNDIDIIAFNMNQSISALVSNCTLFVGSIIMMLITNWIMALTAILSTLVGFFFMFKILNVSQKYFIRKQQELGEINGYIEEMYSGHNVVKAYNGTKDAVKEFDKLNQKLYESNRKSQFLSGLMGPLMGFIGNFGYVAV